MNWKNIKDTVGDLFVNTLIAIAAIFMIIGITSTFNKCTNQTSSPVERNVIDSIEYENDKLVIEITNLDSIKNAKVVEIKALDNDSTLRLFYELISK